MGKRPRTASIISFWIVLGVGCSVDHAPSAQDSSTQDTPDSSMPDSGTPDSGTPDSGTLGMVTSRVLVQSQRAWSSLVGERGDTYWYKVTTCGQGYRLIVWVQVTDGAVSLVARETEENVRCRDDEPYVYAAFDGRLFEDLYAECGQLIANAGIDDVRLEVDEELVVRSCWRTSPDCFDACDDGFHIAERGFGDADYFDGRCAPPPLDDAGAPLDDAGPEPRFVECIRP
jgi:hypothetical protein